MNIKLKKIDNPSRSNDFLLLPWKIYINDKNWVPPVLMMEKDLLNPQKNPFFKHAEVEFYVAYKNNISIGRIAAILNYNHNKFHDENICFFGFFECLNDAEAAKALFEKTAEFARKHKCSSIRGPASYSTNEQCGLLVKGFNLPPAIMMNFNPEYYVSLIENNGFQKTKDLYAWSVRKEEFNPRILHIAEKLLKKNNIKIRSVNLKKFDDEIKLVKEIYNSAWEKNWGFIPMTEEEFDHTAKDFKMIVKPYLVPLAEIDGKTVGFAMGLPDMNQAFKYLNGRLFPFGIFKLLYFKRKINRIRVLTLGILKEYRGKGIDLLLYSTLFKNGTENGFPEGEFSWILEDNRLMNEALEKMGAHLDKIYRIYDKII